MGITAGIAFGIQGLTQVGGSILSAQSQRLQGQYQRQQYEYNSKLADMQSGEALARGETQATRLESGVRKVQGAQRAGLAAQGIDVNSGSAALTQEATAELGAHDVRTVRNNAWLDAWGYKMQATDLNFKGQFADLASQRESTNTLLTGSLMGASSILKGASALDNWGLNRGVGPAAPSAEGGGGPGGYAQSYLY